MEIEDDPTTKIATAINSIIHKARREGQLTGNIPLPLRPGESQDHFLTVSVRPIVSGVSLLHRLLPTTPRQHHRKLHERQHYHHKTARRNQIQRRHTTRHHWRQSTLPAHPPRWSTITIKIQNKNISHSCVRNSSWERTYLISTEKCTNQYKELPWAQKWPPPTPTSSWTI